MEAGEINLNFTAKNKLENLEIFRNIVTALTNSFLYEITQYDISLAVNEAVTNVIKYGYKEPGKAVVTLKMEIKSKDEILIQLKDKGKKFDATKYYSDHKNALKETRDRRLSNGRGIAIINKLMDEIKYRRYKGTNILTMKKKFKERIK